MATRAKAGSRKGAREEAASSAKKGARETATKASTSARASRAPKPPKWPWIEARGIRLLGLDERAEALVRDLAFRLLGGPSGSRPDAGFRDGSPQGIAAWMRWEFLRSANAQRGVLAAVREWVSLALRAWGCFNLVEAIAESEAEKQTARAASAAFDEALRAQGLRRIAEVLEHVRSRQPMLPPLPSIEHDGPRDVLARLWKWIDAAPEVDEPLRSEVLAKLFDFLSPAESVLPVLFEDFSGFVDRDEEVHELDRWQRAFVQALAEGSGSPMKSGDVRKRAMELLRLGESMSSSPRETYPQADKLWNIGRKDRRPRPAIGLLIERTKPLPGNTDALWTLLPHRRRPRS